MAAKNSKPWFYLLFQALKGAEAEFTKGSINRAIFFLSVPMIAEMVMESIFALVDAYFVSKIGTNAIATVGLTESVLMILYSVAIGLSMGTTALVARRVGEGDKVRAANAAFQAIVIALAIGGVISVIGLFQAGNILRMMGGEEELIRGGKGFTAIMFGGSLSIFLLFLNNAIFRGAGDASIAMRSLWLANGLNLVLDPLLIFGIGSFEGFGIEGAAIATTIGRSIGVMYQVFHLTNVKRIVSIGVENMVLRASTIWEMLKISAGGMGQFLVETASWILLVRIMSLFGSEALAGYTIAFRIIMFTILPSWGLSNAAATLVGQNLGAGLPERAEQSVWRTAMYNMIFLGIVSVVFFFSADLLISQFTEEPEVLRIGVSALHIICFGYVFFAYGMVVTQAFNGAGDTRTPLFINLLVFWVIQIPLSYWLAVVQGFEEKGVFFCVAFSHSLLAVVSILLFRRGRWKTTSV